MRIALGLLLMIAICWPLSARAGQNVSGVVLAATYASPPASAPGKGNPPHNTISTWGILFQDTPSTGSPCKIFVREDFETKNRNLAQEYSALKGKMVTLDNVRPAYKEKYRGQACLFSGYRITGEDPLRPKAESGEIHSLALNMCEKDSRMKSKFICSCMADVIVKKKSGDIAKHAAQYREPIEERHVVNAMTELKNDGGLVPCRNIREMVKDRHQKCIANPKYDMLGGRKNEFCNCVDTAYIKLYGERPNDRIGQSDIISMMSGSEYACTARFGIR